MNPKIEYLLNDFIENIEYYYPNIKQAFPEIHLEEMTKDNLKGILEELLNIYHTSSDVYKLVYLIYKNLDYIYLPQSKYVKSM